jgi:hypothetical protein
VYQRKKFIDNVQSFAPGIESWVAKPVAELPKTITVKFETGLTGILNMQDRRAVIWAKLLDLQQRYNKPVYVEIDPETKIVIQLLVPEASRVMSIKDEGKGDVDVAFFTSQAQHYLRRDNPDFKKMLDALQYAKDMRKTILVTATQDDHEIIDVRPLPKGLGVETPGTPSPPQPDPSVSLQRAQELFDLMKSKSCDACTASCGTYPHCIPFKHANDGCYARAHEMCRLMMDEGETPEKIWIYGNLHVVTSNVHECDINWSWHVAPTLMVETTPGSPPEKYVIDPSLCNTPVTEADWKALQNPAAFLRYSTWEPFWSDWWMHPEEDWTDLGINDPGFTQTNYYLEQKCILLQKDCVDYGPPPYACPVVKSSHFILDRSTFSESEIDAMLSIASPAEIAAAFYVVVDGFAPEELGITSSTLSGIPNIKPILTLTPGISQMTAEFVSLDVEDPSHLKRRQRLTWTGKIVFAGTAGFGFADDIKPVNLSASISTVTCNATIYLIKQPNPYEIDGQTSWLSTDLRVFQIKTGESKFGVTMISDALGFITQVIANLNSGNSSGQTFENDISTDPQTSQLELSQTVGGTPVYNFAIAKVRYLSLAASATDVRVFFRLFPVATTSVEYDQATGYRRYETPSKVVPLIGIKNGQLTSIPCFATSRVNSAIDSLTTQDDAPNVQTIPANASGAEMVRYFGCWLDINQTQPQFPTNPSPVNGPYASGRISIYDHIRNQHQCLVSEIAFSHAPIPNGSTPSTSDKLAQRNLFIVESANPGFIASRRIPQTFELRPSSSKVEEDELMIDWGNVPVGSVATLYLPDFDTNDILSLAAKKYRSHRMIFIDKHTLQFETGGMSYVPIPFADGSFPGMLTVDLPEGVKRGQVFTILVRQVTGEQDPIVANRRIESFKRGWRRIAGSFQMTIPVHRKEDILPGQQRLLSNLRWIERSIPADDRWSSVFGKYVSQVAERVDALGGESNKVGASPSGEWREAYRNCLLMPLVTIALTAMFVVAVGVIDGFLAMSSVLVLVLLVGTVYLWRNRCRPKICRLLLALLAGSGIGAIILSLFALLAGTTPQLLATLAASIGAFILVAIRSLQSGCFS